ncbi:MAG: hypothetical protein WCP35_16240 [Verrucomicrobiota bacterium]
MVSRLSSILKALPPLINASSGLAGLLGERKDRQRDLITAPERAKREEDMLRLGAVLADAMEQLQATAQELRAQAQVYESQRSRIRLACILSVLALLMSAASLLLAFYS